MHVEPHHTPDELAALARAEPAGKVARRIQAVRLAALGHTAEAVGPQVLLSGRQVKTWVARSNAGGAGALASRPKSGRPGPLTPDQAGRLRARLGAGPTAADGVCALRGADVRRILRDEFGVVRCLQAVYDLLHRLGYDPLRPRPRHPAASAGAQAAFRKACPRSSPASRPPGRGSGSRCGSRTRPGSAGRAP